MQLSTYLKSNDLTMEHFASLIGVTQSAVSRYSRGQQVPGRDIMSRIYRATGGAVGPRDFYDLHDPPPISSVDDPPSPSGPKEEAVA